MQARSTGEPPLGHRYFKGTETFGGPVNRVGLFAINPNLTLFRLEGGLFELYKIPPGCLTSLRVIVLVSLPGPAPSAAIAAEFNPVNQRLR